MTERKIYYGSAGPFLYEDTDIVDDADGDFAGEGYGAFVSDGQGYIREAPTSENQICLFGTLGGRILGAISVTDITDPTELNSVEATNGCLVTVFQARAGDTDLWTLYLWDETVPGAFDSPFLVEGSDGVWIAVAGEYSYVKTVVRNDDGEVHLTPKSSSSSTLEGTMYYDSDDNHVYVGVE